MILKLAICKWLSPNGFDLNITLFDKLSVCNIITLMCPLVNIIRCMT